MHTATQVLVEIGVVLTVLSAINTKSFAILHSRQSVDAFVGLIVGLALLAWACYTPVPNVAVPVCFALQRIEGGLQHRSLTRPSQALSIARGVVQLVLGATLLGLSGSRLLYLSAVVPLIGIPLLIQAFLDDTT